jgi:putative ABC transport system permease protein
MDIATAQWRLERVGVLQRIDVKLEPGTSIIAFQRAIQSDITPGVVVTPPQGEAERSSNLSRAYRTNLDMLALVTLFTGAFLIFSTQFLSITRRRTQLGVLRALGLTRARLCGWIVLEGAIVGVCGSALGLVLGYLIAELGLERFGGDLGAGYFNGNQPQLSLEPTASTIFFLLGVLFATAGAALPAFEAARRAPALALKAGDEEMPLRRLGRARPGLLLMAAGFVLSQAPPLAELPIWGYLSIALVLTGAILMMPWFATFILVRLPQLRFTPAALARAQLQATPRQVGVSLAAILASFSLMVSMVLMVGSFRTSLAVWLNTMLAADLYVRAGGAGESGYFTPEEESAIQRTRGVRDAMFTRSQNIFLRADRAPFTLIARSIASGKFEPDLPFQGPTLGPTANDLPYAWVSEVAADLLGVKTGAQIELPIGKALLTFRVAGVWRDYARQNGAIVIARPLYVALTGDARTNDAALNLDAAASIGEVSQRLRNVFDHGDAVDIVSTRELKNKSLAIFDRTFAVTYALEIAAVLLGLFGVSASFSAQALARQREFGVLRHMGMTRSQISAMLGAEGLIVGGLGVAAGLTLGWIISLILIHVINRQSFHWTMEIYPPWHTLALLAGVMIIAATATAVLSARLAMSEHVTRAVREDW